MKGVSFLGLVAIVLLVDACGSSNDRRNPIRRDDDAGLDGGSGGAGAGGRSSGGASSGGQVSSGGSGNQGGDGGRDASTGDGGSAGDGGAAPVPDASADGGAAEAGVDAGPPLACGPGLADCDGERDNGCEVTLATSNEHCGECQRNCTTAGATCSQSRCTAVPLQTIGAGSDNSGARTWASDGNAAYALGFNSYVLRRLPFDGSASTVIWDGSTSSKTGGTESLVIDGTDALWSERGTPSVVLRKNVTAPAGTVPSVAFTPEAHAQFLVIQGQTLYYTTGVYQSGGTQGFIYSRPLSAPSTSFGTKIVTANQGVHGAMVAFAASTDAVYWVTADTTSGAAYDLRTAPLAGGTPVSLPGGAITGYPFNERVSLRTAGNVLYFNRNVDASFLNGIYRYAPGDAAPTEIVTSEDVTNFVLDTNHIYFVKNGGQVWRAPIAGGAEEQVNGGSLGASEIVGQDAKYLYVSQSSCCSTTLYKVVK